VNPVLSSTQFFLLAALVFLGLGSVVTALLARSVGARLERWEPCARHRALVLFASLPALATLVLLFAASLPSLIALVVPGLDHCPGHDDGHVHLCFVHLPTVGMSSVPTLGLVFLATAAVVRAALAVSSALRAGRIVTALAKTGEERTDLDLTFVATEHPVCMVAGLFRPRLLFSRALFDSLSAEQRAVILAHERAHVTRRDALFGGVVRALAVMHLPWVGRWLVQELEVAAEQACDEEAARWTGDRLAVAETILAVERAAQRTPVWQLSPFAVAFGARAVERRVEALLVEPTEGQSLRPLVFALGVVLVSLLALADPLHHLTESVLSVIAY
jgi:Zn-dependent protease with chaperone function